MNILLTGSSGFIGSAVMQRLLAAGHRLRCTVRTAPPGLRDDVEWVRLDLSRALTPEAWQAHLDGIDVVVNCAGIFEEGDGQTFSIVHERAPGALFEACARARLSRVVQVSALGADDRADTAFLQSKRAADRHLAGLPVPSHILYPSLVYGEGGRSATLFRRLAVLPLLVLPDGGRQRIQPVHLCDLAEAVTRAAETPGGGCQRVPVVGPQAVTLAGFLSDLRAGMGMSRRVDVFELPAALLPVAARAGSRLTGFPVSGDALAMLARGSTADAASLTALLGHPPRPSARFIRPDEAPAARTLALLHWLLPLLRLSVAALWLWTALVSFWLHPLADSLALLARAGAEGTVALLLLHGAAALDLLLGVLALTLPLRRRRALWAIQIALIVFYSTVIAFALPEFWLHPFGPLAKNVPLVACLLLLFALDVPPHRPAPWITRH